MHLYRFEIYVNNQIYHGVVAGESEEDAFRLVDVELEKQLIHLSDVQNISLYEKKKIHKGAGFVLTKFES